MSVVLVKWVSLFSSSQRVAPPKYERISVILERARVRTKKVQAKISSALGPKLIKKLHPAAAESALFVTGCLCGARGVFLVEVLKLHSEGILEEAPDSYVGTRILCNQVDDRV